MWACVLACVLLTQTDWPTTVKPLMDQVVRIEVLTQDPDGTDTLVRCSGALLNAEGYVLTAAHCVRHTPQGGLSITVNGRHADLLRQNALLDLAVLHMSVKGEHAMLLADGTPPVGSEVAMLGYAYGSKLLHMQFGRVALPVDETGALMLDVTTLFGDSGGPAVNARGELVGMTSAIKVAGGYLTVMVPVDRVRDFARLYLPRK